MTRIDTSEMTWQEQWDMVERANGKYKSYELMQNGKVRMDDKYTGLVDSYWTDDARLAGKIAHINIAGYGFTTYFQF